MNDCRLIKPFKLQVCAEASLSSNHSSEVEQAKFRGVWSINEVSNGLGLSVLGPKSNSGYNRQKFLLQVRNPIFIPAPQWLPRPRRNPNELTLPNGISSCDAVLEAVREIARVAIRGSDL